jgi:RimJ/RimL family protein N-acetyltransferase
MPTELKEVTGPVELAGERVVLREYREDDWRAIQRYASDPEVCRFMKWGPNTEEETRDHVNGSVQSAGERPRRKFNLAVTLRNTGDLIGGCGLVVGNPGEREGWIGYVFAREHWGRGYATEAAQRLVRFGFEELGLHRIFATCDPENRASARVLEKAGMQLEGRLRSHAFIKGRWRDSLLFAILEEDVRPG